MPNRSLQQRYAPNSICFGCGPANSQGLRIESFAQGDVLVCHFTPEAHHHAFPGMVNGGILGALLDCHSNWAAAHHLMGVRSLQHPPCTVTAEFHVKLPRPSPMLELKLVARAVKVDGERVTVEASAEADGKIRATCVGVFVAVKEGHPAFHRWN